MSRQHSGLTCGGNGAGKSTFLGILMGITEWDAGLIELQARVVDRAALRRATGFGRPVTTALPRF